MFQEKTRASSTQLLSDDNYTFASASEGSSEQKSGAWIQKNLIIAHNLLLP